MAYTPDMRASDGDREKISARLRDAHADGRLSAEEFQLRLDALYDARTYGEIEPLVRDLPAIRTATTPASVPQVVPAATSTVTKRTGGDKALAVLWTIWACAVSVNLVVWTLVSVSNLSFEYFWPAWVAGPWGAVLLSITLIRRAAKD